MKIDRLIGIVTILLQQEKITMPELAARFEVSRRTISRDIDAICRAGIPLVTAQGYGGGVSVAEGFRLDRSLLTKDELQVILSGVKGLDSVWDTPHAGSLSEKLSADTSDTILIDLASHYQTSLIKKIAAIREAIEDRRHISFRYYYEKGECSRTIEPYKLVFKWSAWYVWGWCLGREDFRLFKLNRLWGLKIGTSTFALRDLSRQELNFDCHLAAGAIHLKALFEKGEKYRLIEEYGPDCYCEHQGKLLLEQDFASYSNMREWVLSFGSQAEVLEPEGLRADLLQQAETLLKKYQGT